MPTAFSTNWPKDDEERLQAEREAHLRKIREAWSDAARAAAAAGRKGRGKGTAARKAAAAVAFKQAGGKRSSYAVARKSVQRAVKQTFRDFDNDPDFSEDRISDRADAKMRSSIHKLSRAASRRGITAAGRKELTKAKRFAGADDLTPGTHWHLSGALKGIRQSRSIRARKGKLKR